MRALDLYSGVGGWTLGLRIAGIDVIRSLEWWPQANETHGANMGSQIEAVDIRSLPLDNLPAPGDVDLVVGSPPCTQFSYSNRGGNGDIADGLVDVYRMLEIVEYLRPTYWVMENVPRVSRILDHELSPLGSLARFRNLVTVNKVFDLADFGLPQSRRRMLAGNFPLQTLEGYRGRFPQRHLADVIAALESEPVVDPLFGYVVPQSQLSDHVKEQPLTQEESRLNRESKAYHPVYNKMSFPDGLARPARTVTATCTRVSRESIVVRDSDVNGVRRLTIRERACLQGFPVTYQFFGRTYTDRLKMIGNAIPPFFTYQIACAVIGLESDEVQHPSQRPYQHECVAGPSESVLPNASPAKYPKQRSFRAAVPGLRFGSGVRFELRNEFEGDGVRWSIRFLYGNSKRIIEGDLARAHVVPAAQELGLDELLAITAQETAPVRDFWARCSPDLLQERWTRRAEGPGPFELVDLVGSAVERVRSRLPRSVDGVLLELAKALFPNINPGRTSNDLQLMAVAATVAAEFSANDVSSAYASSTGKTGTEQQQQHPHMMSFP